MSQTDFSSRIDRIKANAPERPQEDTFFRYKPRRTDIVGLGLYVSCLAPLLFAIANRLDTIFELENTTSQNIAEVTLSSFSTAVLIFLPIASIFTAIEAYAIYRISKRKLKPSEMSPENIARRIERRKYSDRAVGLLLGIASVSYYGLSLRAAEFETSILQYFAKYCTLLVFCQLFAAIQRPVAILLQQRRVAWRTPLFFMIGATLTFSAFHFSILSVSDMDNIALRIQNSF